MGTVMGNGSWLPSPTGQIFADRTDFWRPACLELLPTLGMGLAEQMVAYATIVDATICMLMVA
jgi:hypothetical protein